MPNTEIIAASKRLAEQLAYCAEHEGEWIMPPAVDRQTRPIWQTSRRLRDWGIFYKPLKQPSAGFFPEISFGVNREWVTTGFLMGCGRLFSIYQVIGLGLEHCSFRVMNFSNTDLEDPDALPTYENTNLHFFDGRQARATPTVKVNYFKCPSRIEWNTWDSEITPTHYRANWDGNNLMDLAVYPHVGERVYKREVAQGRAKFDQLVLQEFEAPEGWCGYDRRVKQSIIELFSMDLPSKISLSKKYVKLKNFRIPVTIDPDVILTSIVAESGLKRLLTQ